MNTATLVALGIAVPLVVLGVISALFQLRGTRRLRARTHVPSDEFAYLRNRYRRRLLAGATMIVAGSLIAGVYLSGLEGRADALGEPDPNALRDADGKRIMNEAEKNLVRAWGVYWAVVIVLAFVLLGIAVTDAWATRRYWLGVYRLLKDEHQTQLRRDLAVYKAHVEQARTAGREGFGGRLGGGGN